MLGLASVFIEGSAIQVYCLLVMTLILLSVLFLRAMSALPIRLEFPIVLDRLSYPVLLFLLVRVHARLLKIGVAAICAAC